MNRINTTSPCLARSIRTAALAMVLFALVRPQPARPAALMYAEAAAWMRADPASFNRWPSGPRAAAASTIAHAPATRRPLALR